MKYQTLCRSDSVIDYDGNSMFDSLLLQVGISEKDSSQIDSIEISYNLLNAYNEKGIEILDTLKI